ncbi:MAG: thioesterase family protein [Rhodospirillales bacterium]
MNDASSSGWIATYRATIEPAWIDYNGHLNVAYYLLLFDRALDAALETFGIGPAYRQAHGCSVFVGEHHLVYDREVLAQACVHIGSRILDVDERRLIIFQEMRVDAPVPDVTPPAEAAAPVATCETLCVHVDLVARRSVAWPPDMGERLKRSCVGPAERPGRAGRAIHLARR